ncbi:MAG: carbon storage regulator [Gammaproteobacteria bacterium]|nr:carbon storage regulator [Gammaproteobacteria bacterium]
MLVLSFQQEDSFIIFPARDIKPNMTVAELFKDGPILIKCTRGGGQWGIEAPQELKILRSELCDL